MDAGEARAAADAALRELGAATGAGDLALDAEGVCLLAFEDGATLYLVLDAPAGELLLWTAAGEVPAEGAEPALRQLLQANLFGRGTGGATLALAPDGRTVVLARRLLLELTTGALLQGEIGAMLDRAAATSGALLAGPAEPPAAPRGLGAAALLSAIRG